MPTTSAISQALTRLGATPLKLLLKRIAVPMAWPGAGGAWLHGLPVMAIDGSRARRPCQPGQQQEFRPLGNDQPLGWEVR